MSSNVKVLHAKKECNHAVAVGSLRVIIQKIQDGWFAQGVEIDFAACGETLDDAQIRFEKGLAATVHRHLERFDSVERLLKFAPNDVVEKLSKGDEYSFDMITIHDLSDTLGLPFQKIAYLEPLPHAV
ncbi:MAG: hypothetical protein AB2795_19975 [Candidatus Thiodiazotropha endolucinida]